MESGAVRRNALREHMERLLQHCGLSKVESRRDAMSRRLCFDATCSLCRTRFTFHINDEEIAIDPLDLAPFIRAVDGAHRCDLLGEST